MAIVFLLTRVTMLPIFILFFCAPPMALSLVFTKIPLPAGVRGPESFAFDSLGGGPYTGVSDGRILKYQGRAGFTDFAYTTPTRSKALCDGQTTGLEPTCGRPLGLDFNTSTNQLYVADAYFGLSVAGPNGRLTTQLASGVNGVPFIFLDGLGLDPTTGNVYFTQFSARFQLRNILQSISSGDATGALFKYNIQTKQVTVLLSGLSGAAGTAVSSDGSFALVSEFTGKRIRRFWLKGARRNTSETFITLQGMPDNIRRAANGDFWVAVNVLKRGTLGTVPTRIRINPLGKVVASVALDKEYNTTLISEVQEFHGTIYVGSLLTNFVGLYRII